MTRLIFTIKRADEEVLPIEVIGRPFAFEGAFIMYIMNQQYQNMNEAERNDLIDGGNFIRMVRLNNVLPNEAEAIVIIKPQQRYLRIFDEFNCDNFMDWANNGNNQFPRDIVVLPHESRLTITHCEKNADIHIAQDGGKRRGSKKTSNKYKKRSSKKRLTRKHKTSRKRHV